MQARDRQPGHQKPDLAACMTLTHRKCRERAKAHSLALNMGDVVAGGLVSVPLQNGLICTAAGTPPMAQRIAGVDDLDQGCRSGWRLLAFFRDRPGVEVLPEP
jgi:hypothetical protein